MQFPVHAMNRLLLSQRMTALYFIHILHINHLRCMLFLLSRGQTKNMKSEIHIVGASAWNPPRRNSERTKRPSSMSTPSFLPSNYSMGLASEAVTSNSSFLSSSRYNPETLDFLIVSYSGTHVRCSAASVVDREKWLAALRSGLGGEIPGRAKETLTVIGAKSSSTLRVEGGEKFSEQRWTSRIGLAASDDYNVNYEGGDKKYNAILDSAVAFATCAIEAESSYRPLVPPLPQQQGTNTVGPIQLDDLGGVIMNRLITTGYCSPCDDRISPPSDVHCTACGCRPPSVAMHIDAAPLPEYGMEVRADLCHDCLIAGGVIRHVRFLNKLYEVEARDRAALRMAWMEVKCIIGRISELESLGEKWRYCNGSVSPRGSLPNRNIGVVEDAAQTMTPAHRATNEDVHLSLPISSSSGPSSPNNNINCDDRIATCEDAIVDLVGTENFVAYRLDSNTLDLLCQTLEVRGFGCVPIFLECLEERATASASFCLFGGAEEPGVGGGGEYSPTTDNDKSSGSGRSDSVSSSRNDTIGMKVEAFKVAGDMSAALRLLYEYALPPEYRRHDSRNARRDDADMLSAILEFFLDLCEQGQIDSVAFYWPQLCHIHRQMLPPRDFEELIRVELMEDFLITVSTRYSVHLALDLIWSLTADLEESLGSSSHCHYHTRGRRYAILRFVSELESLLYDFDGGWGGGSVSLRGMLSPSQHQATLLRNAMSLLQVWRRFGSHFLSRSVRLDKLRAEALETVGYSPTAADNVRLRASIAKNASYFSSHINFARKLGDIAEKLRFMKPEHRSEALVKELTEINASGKVLGGDPLNRLCSDGRFQKTAHVPINEGHVFRSKERTPVLLLAELVSDPRGAKTALYSASQVYVNGVNENHSILHDREEILYGNDQPEQEDVSLQTKLSEAQGSTEEIIGGNGSLLLDQAQSGENNEIEISCPESPLSHGSPSLHYRALSHGLLNSPPRGSLDFGKEMMVDMIATLIDNQQYSIPSQPLDYNIDHISAPPLQNIAIGIAEESRIYPQITHDDVERESVEIIQPRCDWSEKHDRIMFNRAELGDDRKLSALGSVLIGNATPPLADVSQNKALHLTATGQFRRDVLVAIMDRGMRGNNVIGKGAATAARRAIQAIDRSRAISLMNGSDNVTDNGVVEQNVTSVTSYDEDKLMEALRLLIIQNRAAKGITSSSGHNGVDAGEVDKRLAGCGQISSSLLSSLRLWKGGIVSNRELLDLVQKDLLFLKHSVAFGFLDESKLIEDSAFWGRFSFGERWAEKKARLAALSPHGSSPEWDLIGCIVKSNDDLRQEAFVMQLIVLCDEAFCTAGLDLWIHPYNIVATGRSTGIIECVRDAMSFDSLKKRPGYGTDGLVGHFKRMAEIAADPFMALNESKLNFVRSLAAYSLMSYLFMFKDRHNGNLLLDTAGHVIHIDFGFVFGIAPGGSFSLEQSTPFKLTDEMLEVMGGLGSPLFSEFVTLFCCGFLALQVHADTFLTVVEVTCRGSSFHCFDGKDPKEIVMMLRERFCPDLNKSQTVAYALDLIKFATTSYGTKQYDYFQYLSQGIAT